MSLPQDFVSNPISYLVAAGLTAIGWLAKWIRTDQKETREVLLRMQREQSEAMHATAQALDRNTEALERNTGVIRTIAHDQLPPPSSGPR